MGSRCKLIEAASDPGAISEVFEALDFLHIVKRSSGSRYYVVPFFFDDFEFEDFFALTHPVAA